MAKSMTLEQWCARFGRGPSAQARALGISRSTLWRLLDGDHEVHQSTAKQIEVATGGDVTAAFLLGLEPPAKRKASA